MSQFVSTCEWDDEVAAIVTEKNMRNDMILHYLVRKLYYLIRIIKYKII